MADVKWAIMNNFDVEGPDPKHGISMVISDTADEAITKRIERFRTGECDDYDMNRDVEFTDPITHELSDGWYIISQHAYYYTVEEPDREIHSVFTAWPVYVD